MSMGMLMSMGMGMSMSMTFLIFFVTCINSSLRHCQYIQLVARCPRFRPKSSVPPHAVHDEVALFSQVHLTNTPGSSLSIYYASSSLVLVHDLVFCCFFSFIFSLCMSFFIFSFIYRFWNSVLRQRGAEHALEKPGVKEECVEVQVFLNASLSLSLRLSFRLFHFHHFHRSR